MGKASIKVLDFGIVRMAGSGLTHHGVLVGTVNYMSPEQIAGSGTIDHRSDVFAVGTVCYELLTSKRAFPGEMAEVLYKIVHAEPEPLGSVCPGIEPAIERAVHRCLDKSPDRRYQDLTPLRRDLSRIRQRLEVEESESGSTAVRPHDAPVSTPPPIPPDTVAPLLTEAESALARQDVDRAISVAEHAVALAPHDPRPRELLQKAERVRRARTLAGALNHAQTAFDRRDYDSALQATDEALAADPQNQVARGLKRQIDAAIAEIRRLEAHERAALEAIAQAKRLFADGKHAAAFDRLERFAPPHAEVTRAIEDLGALLEQQERARRELEARTDQVRQLAAAARQSLALDDLAGAGARLQEAAALGVAEVEVESVRRAMDVRARELQRATQSLEDGEALLARGELERARQAAEEAYRLRPGDATAVTLANRVQKAFDERKAEEARRHAEQERQRTIDAWLREAGSAPDEQRTHAALNKIFEIDPANAEARRLLEDMRRRQEEKRRQIQDQIARGGKAVDEGRFADAVKFLRPLAQGPEASHDGAFLELLSRAEKGFELAEAERRRQEKIAADLKTAADKAARAEFSAARAIIQTILTQEPGHARARALRAEVVKAEELHARAENTSEKALSLFERGDHAGAIALLERFSPTHPLATATLADLRARFDAIQRETRRAEQAARRRELVRSASATLGALVRDRRLQGLIAATVLAVGAWSLWSTSEYALVLPPPGPRHKTDLVIKTEADKPYDMEEALRREQQGQHEGRTSTGAASGAGTEAPRGLPESSGTIAVRKLPSGTQRPESQAGGVTSPGAAGGAGQGGTQSAGAGPSGGQSSTQQPAGGQTAGLPPAGSESAAVPSSAGTTNPAGPGTVAGGESTKPPEATTPLGGGATGPTGPSLQELARQDIREWLATYKEAYGAMNVDAIRRMHPVAGENLSKSHIRLQAASVEFSNEQVQVTQDGQAAFLQADVVYRYRWRVGSGPAEQRGQIKWTLRRSDSSWVVAR